MRSARALLSAMAVVGLVVGSGCTGLVDHGAAPAAAAPVPRLLASATPDTLSTSIPATPAGDQLHWVLGAVDDSPLTQQVIAAHFDARFLALVNAAELNSVFAEFHSTAGDSFVGLLSEDPFNSSLEAIADFGGVVLKVGLTVDGAGLIDGLDFSPDPLKTSWAQIDRRLAAVAPGVGFLAAKVSSSGECVPVHQVAASTPRPTASMFKLFVLGALAHQIESGRVRWNQELTVEESMKSAGSGTLRYEPDGTRITVRQTALKMISVSDNTAADMLIHLVGRAAVEAQVRKWSDHAALDVPFLTTREALGLHDVDFPVLADQYLSLTPGRRQAFLTTRVDPLPLDQLLASGVPRDVNSIEWFASPGDLCRALAGLQQLRERPDLAPIGSVLSANQGGLGLDPGQWPTVWFKGGSEPGVLTLGYRAESSRGRSVVVVAMVEDPTEALPAIVPLELLSIVRGAFGLLG